MNRTLGFFKGPLEFAVIQKYNIGISVPNIARMLLIFLTITVSIAIPVSMGVCRGTKWAFPPPWKLGPRSKNFEKT